MRQIRLGTFETNSSSTHSLVIGTPEQIEKWENGELFVNYCDDYATEFKTKEELDQMEVETKKRDIIFTEKVGRMEKSGMKQQNISTTTLKLLRLPVENSFQLFVLMVEMANY